MSFESIMRGLEEAVEIREGRRQGRRQKVSISPLETITSEDVKLLRIKLNVTQIAFSAIMGVSTKTVEAWEKGTNVPNGTARRLISLLNTEPELLETHKILTR